jgi:hypothetical protein
LVKLVRGLGILGAFSKTWAQLEIVAGILCKCVVMLQSTSLTKDLGASAF